MSHFRVILVLAWLALVSLALAQTETLSENAIGFHPLEFASGGTDLVRNDFVATGDDPVTVDSLLRIQLPPSTVVHIWDHWNDSGGYVSATNRPDTGWAGDGAEAPLSPGMGFWVDLSHPDIADGPWHVWLYGEVPGANNGRTETALRTSGVDLVGYPYPAKVNLFSATELARSAPAFTIIHRCDGTGSGEDLAATKGEEGRWEGPAVELGNLRPCEGFWIDSTGTGEDSISAV
jgi:hypothetical protein